MDLLERPEQSNRGAQSRMVSGYLLRDIVNKINVIQFSSSEDTHMLSHLYESCCVRCVTPLATPASSTPRVRSCASWCRSLNRPIDAHPKDC